MSTAIRAQIFITLGCLFFYTPLYAIEKSRPLSSLESNLVEITFGMALDEKIYEIGLDYEYFLPSMDHHLSIGIASEIEFMQEGHEYFIAPLLSIYYYHTKLFLSSGLLTDFSLRNHWKTRVGVGYEFFLDGHKLIMVPTVAWDMVEGESQYPAIVLGIAREF